MQTLLLTWNPGADDDHVWSPEEWYQEMVRPTSAGDTVIDNWSIWLNRRSVAPDDRVYLYRQGSHGRGLVAVGHTTSGAFPAPRWDDPDPDSSADYVDVVWTTCLPLEERITVEELDAAVPEFRWSQVFASGRRLTEPVAAKVDRLWDHRVGGPRPPEDPSSSPRFGDADTNDEVEAAAMNVVTMAYRDQGYEVENVSAKKCGWDLTACRNREVVHVEVKGVSGETVKFFLTANEHRHAQSDPRWALAAVTTALTDPQMRTVERDVILTRAVPSVYTVEVPPEAWH